jgi:hypothetical protein
LNYTAAKQAVDLIGEEFLNILLSGLFREMLGEMAERLRWLDDRCRRYEERKRTPYKMGASAFAADCVCDAIGTYFAHVH